MSLYPGGPRKAENKFVLDDTAMQDSMAKAIEDALADVFGKVKDMPLPEAGKEERRLLFVAMARGILGYLEAHQKDLLTSITTQVTASTSETRTVVAVDLNVIMDKP